MLAGTAGAERNSYHGSLSTKPPFLFFRILLPYSRRLHIFFPPLSLAIALIHFFPSLAVFCVCSHLFSPLHGHLFTGSSYFVRTHPSHLFFFHPVFPVLHLTSSSPTHLRVCILSPSLSPTPVNSQFSTVANNGLVVDASLPLSVSPTFSCSNCFMCAWWQWICSQERFDYSLYFDLMFHTLLSMGLH